MFFRFRYPRGGIKSLPSRVGTNREQRGRTTWRDTWAWRSLGDGRDRGDSEGRGRREGLARLEGRGRQEGLARTGGPGKTGGTSQTGGLGKTGGTSQTGGPGETGAPGVNVGRTDAIDDKLGGKGPSNKQEEDAKVAKGPAAKTDLPSSKQKGKEKERNRRKATD